MSSKRIPLNQRKQSQQTGIDAIIQKTGSASSSKTDTNNVSKVTMYIRPDQETALEEIQLLERKRTGKKRKKSELVQEALDMLIDKYLNTEKH